MTWKVWLVSVVALITSFLPLRALGSEDARKAVQNVLNQLNSNLIVDNVYTLGSYQANVSTELTILTGFIDIGVIDVPGTDNTDHKDPEHYLYWMEMYSVIQNPVVFFTDQDYIADGMLEIRGDLPTLIIVFDKSTAWAFKDLHPRYKEIFSQPDYPKTYPCTVSEDYACVTHSKFEFLQIATDLNYFNTSYMGWCDAGFFRYEVERGDFRPSVLHTPEIFDDSKIALNRVRHPEPNERLDHRYIMKYSPFHFSGGIWFGRPELLRTFAMEYKEAVEIMLDEGLANCEEQAMASLLLRNTQFRSSVDTQIFSAEEGWDPFRYLGYKLRMSGLFEWEDY